jgi:amino acid transporter
MTPALVRDIGRWSLAALVLNGVIGSSVFGLPSVITGRLGSASPYAWLVAAVGIAVIIACFAEVASRFEEAGGPYLYAHAAFGRLAGIQMAWFAYLTRLTASATNANLFVIYLGEFWPGAREPLATRLVLAVVILPLALLNYRGVRHGSRLSSWMIVLKLVPLTAFVLAGLALALPDPAVPVLVATPNLRDWLDVILLLVFAYGGFEAALVPLAEARQPRRDAPFALFLNLGVCAVLYFLVQVVVNSALPDPAATDRPLAAAAGALLGPAGATFMAVAALVSVYGYLAGAMVNVPRLTYAMAERGDLPGMLGRVHPRFRTPYVSVMVFAVLVFLLASLSGFLQNLTMSAVSRLLTYGLVCAALPVFRARDRRPTQPSVRPAGLVLGWGPVWAGLGVGFSLLMATRMTQKESVVLAVTVVLGLMNWVWSRKQVRRTSVDPGGTSEA